MNNADKIRQMSDEELAAKISQNMKCFYCPARELCKGNACRQAIALWLKQEAKDE